jgi:hypothetical protein
MKITIKNIITNTVYSNFETVCSGIGWKYESDIILIYNSEANYQERFFIKKNRFGHHNFYVDYIETIKAYIPGMSEKI